MRDRDIERRLADIDAYSRTRRYVQPCLYCGEPVPTSPGNWAPFCDIEHIRRYIDSPRGDGESLPVASRSVDATKEGGVDAGQIRAAGPRHHYWL